jgi:hypothetical protein
MFIAKFKVEGCLNMPNSSRCCLHTFRGCLGGLFLPFGFLGIVWLIIQSPKAKSKPKQTPP